MASCSYRCIVRSSSSSIRSAIRSNAPKCRTAAYPNPSNSKPSSSNLRFSFSYSRVPFQLGSVASMLPLYDAVAAARTTIRLSSTARACRALSQGS